MIDIKSLQEKALKKVKLSQSLNELETIRLEYLGKKGIITNTLKGLRLLPTDQRSRDGQIINRIKQVLQAALLEHKEKLEHQLMHHKLALETLDISLSGRGEDQGNCHPVTQAKRKLENFFEKIGFYIADGPEIETDYYNFEALNIPSYHPARDMQDSFYLSDKRVLRTQTSPMQIRIMEQQEPPIYLISTGRVYRCDSDLTHTPMFHQIEGLVVDKGIHMGHLKGMLRHFLEDFFETKLKIRLRPSYFPFTEPSAEVDMSCLRCQKRGCRICKNTGWLEIMGCGMVHPKILDNVSINSHKYTGFAFGAGIDRMAMLLYKITDLRANFEGDVRFISQF